MNSHITTDSINSRLRLAVVRRRGHGATVMAFRGPQDCGATLALRESEIEPFVHALANPEAGLSTILEPEPADAQLELAL